MLAFGAAKALGATPRLCKSNEGAPLSKFMTGV